MRNEWQQRYIIYTARIHLAARIQPRRPRSESGSRFLSPARLSYRALARSHVDGNKWKPVTAQEAVDCLGALTSRLNVFLVIKYVIVFSSVVITVSIRSCKSM